MPIKGILDTTNIKERAERLTKLAAQKSADLFERASSGLRDMGGRVAQSPAGQAAGDLAEGVGQQAQKAVQAGVEKVTQGLRAGADAVNPGAQTYRGMTTPPSGGAYNPAYDEFGPARAPTEAPPSKSLFDPQNQKALSERNAFERAQRNPGFDAAERRSAGARFGGGIPPQGPTTPGSSNILGDNGGGGKPKAEKLGLGAKIGRAAGFVARGAGALQAGAGLAEGATSIGTNRAFGVPLPSGRAVDNTFQGVATALHPGVGIAGNVATGLRDAVLRFGVDQFPGLFGLPEQYSNFTPKFAAELRAQDTANELLRRQGKPTINSGRTLGAAPTQLAAADTATPTAPVDDGKVQTSNLGRQTPQEIIEGTGRPVRGQGAIQVTRNGVRQAASRVGGESDEAQAPQRQGVRLAARTPFGVVAEALSRVKAEQMRDSGKLADANLDIKRANARIAGAKAGSEIKATNRSDFLKEIQAEATRRADAQGLTERDPTYKNRVAKDAADLETLYRHTLATKNKDLGDASSAERFELSLLNRLRDRVAVDRSDIGSFFRDFIGDKRFDRDNLYSYAPKSIEKDALGRYNITMPNGNVIKISRAVGKENNWFTPNGPVDGDLMEVIQELAKRQAKDK